MRRSEVASKAAEYQRVIDGLAAAALAAAAEVPFSDSDHGVKELSLRLDLLPSMLRYAISSHTGIEQHVQYQSLERMLLQAFGLEKIMPPERYQNLVELEATLRSQFGDSIIRMLHGQGWAADPTSSDKMEPHANAAAVDLSNPVAFIAKHNSGLHSSGHCSRSLPACCRLQGRRIAPQFAQLLRSGACTRQGCHLLAARRFWLSRHRVL
jgi:hypothetical protein